MTWRFVNLLLRLCTIYSYFVSFTKLLCLRDFCHITMGCDEMSVEWRFCEIRGVGFHFLPTSSLRSFVVSFSRSFCLVGSLLPSVRPSVRPSTLLDVVLRSALDISPPPPSPYPIQPTSFLFLFHSARIHDDGDGDGDDDGFLTIAASPSCRLSVLHHRQYALFL
jgi:hypothetical protein